MNTEDLQQLLEQHLPEPEKARQAVEQPESSLFELGLDSIAAFALLDDLAARGVEVEFTSFVSDPTARFLLAQAG